MKKLHSWHDLFHWTLITAAHLQQTMHSLSWNYWSTWTLTQDLIIFVIRSKMLAFIAPAVDLMLLNENRIPPTIKVQQSHDFPKFNIPRGYHFSLKRLLNLPAFVTSAGASICLQSPSLPPTLLPSLPLPLEVGPLNPVKGSGGALWAPQWGLGWKPQPPTILVHVQGEGTLLVAQYNLTSNYRFCSVARLLWGSKP